MTPGDVLDAGGQWVIPYLPHVFALISFFRLWEFSPSAEYRREFIRRVVYLTLIAVMYLLIWSLDAASTFHDWKQFGWLSSAVFSLTIVGLLVMRYRQFLRMYDRQNRSTAAAQ